MDFINVIKPTHICNLACDYCYNEDERRPIMGAATLDRVISETMTYVREVGRFSKAVFLWHGGEPLVAGMDFYKQVKAIQSQYARDTPFVNHVQTNGTLVDDHWAELFATSGFSVSVSLDGPGYLNDLTRRDHRGQGSFDRIMQSIEILRRHGLTPGVVLTVSGRTIDHAEEIFDFFAQNRLSFQIVELSKSGSAKENFADIGISPEQYANFWTTMYDKWMSPDNTGIDCADFRDRTKALVSGLPVGCQCLFMCADVNISTDPKGDIYPCSTLSGNDNCCYGNVNTTPLAKLMINPVAAAFRSRPTDPQCATCKWFHVCHGGCLSRSLKFKGTINVRDHYCHSLWSTWDHISKRLGEKSISIAAPHPQNLFLDFGIDAKHRANAKPPQRVIPVASLLTLKE